MRKIIAVILGFPPLLAFSGGFEDRVRLAKAAENDEVFKPYQQIMIDGVGEYWANTMRSCFETVEEPQLDAFTLVADITSDGIPLRIDVSPSTNISRCFADGLRNAVFPKPPAYPEPSGFPIVIEMSMKN